jgi:hypothetical protein
MRIPKSAIKKMKRLTNTEEVEDARRRIGELLGERGEWFVREGREGASVELRRGEWELSASAGALVFSYWGESGARTWRVTAWSAEGGRVLLEASRRMGAVRARLELIARASVASAREAVAAARRAECERLAALVCEFADAKLEQTSLSMGARRGEPGRWARIVMRRGRERIAATAPVVPAGAEVAESFLASALLWHARLGEQPRRSRAARSSGEARLSLPPNAEELSDSTEPTSRTNELKPSRTPGGLKLWLVAQPKLAAALAERAALLRGSLRAAVSLFEVDEENGSLTQVRAPELEELLSAHAPRVFRTVEESRSELVESIVALAPVEIDVVRARRGETLRFLGLPFARVRRVMGREHLWFGVEGTPRRAPFNEGASRRAPFNKDASHRVVLDLASAPDLLKLVGELKEHRRADAPDRRHALFRAAPEAWLESILRRDITRLDPGLRLAPLHAQFRASREGTTAARPVDLLALRRDGRLVVVELKVAEDAALALQGADYWRRIEAHRRAGDIVRARLFGDAEVSDEPPLVYLVAPMLRFHRSFAALAHCVRPEVEMYRLDINEDWRAGVRVVRRVPLHN